MRTLVISDLHLGSANARDVLRRPGPQRTLCAHIEGGIDRLVILGDALELRHAPVGTVLAAAEPVFAALGAALGPSGQILLLVGNHDHGLVAPWLEKRGLRRRDAGPLGLEQRAGPRASEAVQRLARAAEPAALDVAHPGAFLREDVYAMHGHYLDRLITVPTFERLIAGAMARVAGPLPEVRATAEDFEAALAPIYAWSQAVAQTPAGTAWATQRDGATSRTWQMLSRSAGTRPTLTARAARVGFPLATRALSRAGLGPLTGRLDGHALRRAGLEALGGVVRRLDVRADHVIFGHTHRAGPLPGDDYAEWRAGIGGTGAALHNAGCWLDEPLLAGDGIESPYWGGRAIELDDVVGSPPRLVRILSDLGAGPG